ncbi:MAG: DUF4366 domain-containing protein [Clostridia bacterium]|nr:DUF4366 domain-containing protein [Clostridia bacterium]
MKRKPIMLLLALILCMSAFALPITAYADAPADTTPPTLTAKVNEGVLHIEASDAESGVEAVFIGGQRVNYRVDGTLDVILRDYAGTGEMVAVYAIDFAGNKSQVVQIKNPYYVKPASPAAQTPESTSTPRPTESAASEQNPFTPAGSATTVDNATDGDGKEFFTITTPDENIFYLIIDRQRESENVYFLNAVTEEDLAALAQKKSGTPGESAVPTPAPTPQPEPEPIPTPEPAPEQPAEKGNGGALIFILLAAAAVGGAGYYFKILKPKQQAQEPDEFDEDDMEFEDDYETPTNEEDYLSPEEDDLTGPEDTE